MRGFGGGRWAEAGDAVGWADAGGGKGGVGAAGEVGAEPIALSVEIDDDGVDLGEVAHQVGPGHAVTRSRRYAVYGSSRRARGLRGP